MRGIKRDKEQWARMQGMKMAYEIAKEEGIEALEQEILQRGLLDICPPVKMQQIRELAERMDDDIRYRVGTASAYAITKVLHMPMTLLDKYLQAMNERCNLYQVDRATYEQDKKMLEGDTITVKLGNQYKKEKDEHGNYKIVRK